MLTINNYIDNKGKTGIDCITVGVRKRALMAIQPILFCVKKIVVVIKASTETQTAVEKEEKEIRKK